MPIYEYECGICMNRFERIRPVSECDKDFPCPQCDSIAKRVQSAAIPKMERIYDNAEYGPRAFFGEPFAKHEEWKGLAEESEMVSRKRQELIDRHELRDFVFEEGKYESGSKTIDEV